MNILINILVNFKIIFLGSPAAQVNATTAPRISNTALNLLTTMAKREREDKEPNKLVTCQPRQDR
jgi:hypothetical protein